MELRDSYCRITKDEISALCAELEIQLPKGYVSFLLRNNGGQPKKNRFLKIDKDGKICFDFYLNVFFGIGGDDTSYDILTMFSIYCDRIPDELLPIGDDGVGNVICIGVEGDYFGKVFIWWKDHEVEEGEEPRFDNVDAIEDSIENFLGGFEAVNLGTD